MDLSVLRKKILSGKDIEDVLKKIDWKDFEKTVAEIFYRHGFKVKQSFRFKTNRKYEIDVLAFRNKLALCVDCKQWSRGREKRSALIKSIKEQKTRAEELKKFLSSNLDFHPLIITLFEEDILKEEETYVVPVWKLNSFLLEAEKFL